MKQHGIILLDLLVSLFLTSVLIGLLLGFSNSAYRHSFSAWHEGSREYRRTLLLQQIKIILKSNSATVLHPSFVLTNDFSLFLARQPFDQLPSSNIISSHQLEAEGVARIMECSLLGNNTIGGKAEIIFNHKPSTDLTRSLIFISADGGGASEGYGSIKRSGSTLSFVATGCPYSLLSKEKIPALCRSSLLIPKIATESFALRKDGSVRLVRSICGEMIENQPLLEEVEAFNIEQRVNSPGIKSHLISVGMDKTSSMEFFSPYQIPIHLALIAFGRNF